MWSTIVSRSLLRLVVQNGLGQTESKYLNKNIHIRQVSEVAISEPARRFSILGTSLKGESWFIFAAAETLVPSSNKYAARMGKLIHVPEY